MIKHFSYLFLLLAIQPVLAQGPSDWGAFSQRVDVTALQGKKFKVEAAVKMVLIDPTAESEIWVRIDKSDKKMGFFYNMMDKPIRTTDWKIFSIEGKIDKKAESLNFGGLYHRRGIFYFDAFKLYIENGNGGWKEMSLPDNSFEGDTTAVRKAWGFLQQRSFFTSAVTSETAYEGRSSFKVDGTSFVKQNTYGNNDSTGKYTVANGVPIYYEEYGSGEPLLLLHGNSESIIGFNKQIPELSKYFRVIAIDTRGQGKSKEDGKKYSYDLFAEDMNALLDCLRLDSVNVLGWSDGGNTGLIMAMKYPAKVKRLAVMGANVFIDKTVVDKWVFKELNEQLKEFKSDTTYKSVNRKRLITMLLTEPNHRFAELLQIRCPVLVMAGEKDVIKEGHTKAIAAGISKSELVIFPGGTHEMPRENPTVFNKTVLDFFAKRTKE
jgi:pimeloyl-ACP methyl ester carboxylesterase